MCLIIPYCVLLLAKTGKHHEKKKKEISFK